MKLRVHPAIKHAQAMLSSVEARTGTPLDEWLALAQASGHLENKPMIAWLRAEKGLGGPTAMAIASKALGHNEDFDAGAYLKRAPSKIDQQYQGKKIALRPLADALFASLDGLGDDVGASPCKTFVPFYRHHVFAQIKAATQKRIDVGLALARYDGDIPPCVTSTGGAAKGDRITHRIAVTAPEDIDSDLIHWIKTAYELDN
jgi:Domain of unknown function (DUF5655)/Domain of unknown function (DUF4287)